MNCLNRMRRSDFNCECRWKLSIPSIFFLFSFCCRHFINRKQVCMPIVWFIGKCPPKRVSYFSIAMLIVKMLQAAKYQAQQFFRMCFKRKREIMLRQWFFYQFWFFTFFWVVFVGMDVEGLLGFVLCGQILIFWTFLRSMTADAFILIKYLSFRHNYRF